MEEAYTISNESVHILTREEKGELCGKDTSKVDVYMYVYIYLQTVDMIVSKYAIILQ